MLLEATKEKNISLRIMKFVSVLWSLGSNVYIYQLVYME